LLGEIVHALPLVEAFSGKVVPVCREENARFNGFRGDGPGGRNGASSDFLTVGTRSGNSARRQPPALCIGTLAWGSPASSQNTEMPADGHTKIKLEPAFFEQPMIGGRRCGGLTSNKGDPLMSNQNQQNQNPGQKPGQQQQGGGQKPGQQQQDPMRKEPKPQQGQQDRDR
jgi:hypothetical protein